jgi:glycerate dehydrogenase
MKAIVLDGYALNPGDLSWQGIAAVTDLTVYDRTPPEQVLARSLDAEILITNKIVFDYKVMRSLPKLKYIGLTATGYNVVDIKAAQQLGITVTNIPAYGSNSVAQFVFAQILALVQPVAYYNDAVQNGRWSESQDFCFYDHSMLELAEMSIGIVGYGAIGKQVARIAQAFGMKVLVCSRSEPEILPEGVDYLGMDQLLARSDFVSIHCPLTEANAGFIDVSFLRKMKPTAFLINTARGALVNELDLAEALANDTIAGVALDVLTVEPAAASNPLLNRSECLITPHIAWATTAARSRMMTITENNLKSFLSGIPINQVTA